MRFWGSLSPDRSLAGTSPKYAPTERLLEAVGILNGEHEGECGKRPDSLDLAQELGFRVMLLRDGFQLALVVTDALGERSDHLQDGPKSRPECLGDVL